MTEKTLTSKKLNLGCGQYPKEGYLNVDFSEDTPADLQHNLDKFPYPFDDEAFELIEADHVLEHLSHPFETMREIHRILEPGGKVIIRVPHCSRGFTHADHKRGFDVTFPYYFNPDFQGGYSGTHFELDSLRLTWFAQPYLKRTVMSPPLFWIGRIMGGIFDFFANLAPFVCSRIWVFWVGGFEEVKFVFKKPQDTA